MNIKAVSKIALGGLCLAAASFGVGKCSNNNNTRTEQEVHYVDNYIDEDVVEVSQPSRADDISYEHNEKLDKRLKRWGYTPEDLESTYREMGTYAATLLLQSTYDFAEIAIGVATNKLKDEIINEGRPEYSPTRQHLNDIADIALGAILAGEDYKEENEAEIKKALCSGGTASKLDCFTYITGALHREGLDDEEMKELNRDLASFDKSLGEETNQTYAEKLAYRQFKKDSIVGAHILESAGLWEDPAIRETYKECVTNYAGKPKP